MGAHRYFPTSGSREEAIFLQPSFDFSAAMNILSPRDVIQIQCKSSVNPQQSQPELGRYPLPGGYSKLISGWHLGQTGVEAIRLLLENKEAFELRSWCRTNSTFAVVRNFRPRKVPHGMEWMTRPATYVIRANASLPPEVPEHQLTAINRGSFVAKPCLSL